MVNATSFRSSWKFELGEGRWINLRPDESNNVILNLKLIYLQPDWDITRVVKELKNVGADVTDESITEDFIDVHKDHFGLVLNYLDKILEKYPKTFYVEITYPVPSKSDIEKMDREFLELEAKRIVEKYGIPKEDK